MPSLPRQKTVAEGYTTISLQSPVVNVNPAGGDTIGANVFQSSSGNLNLMPSGRTFLAVEALG